MTATAKASGTEDQAPRRRARHSMAQMKPVQAPWPAGASTVRANSTCSTDPMCPCDASSAVNP